MPAPSQPELYNVRLWSAAATDLFQLIGVQAYRPSLAGMDLCVFLITTQTMTIPLISVFKDASCIFHESHDYVSHVTIDIL
jgi:hypothetical protein